MSQPPLGVCRALFVFYWAQDPACDGSESQSLGPPLYRSSRCIVTRWRPSWRAASAALAESIGLVNEVVPHE